MSKIENALTTIQRMLEQVVQHQAPIIYNNESLSKYLGVTKGMLRQFRDEGMLEYSRVGNQYFYTQEDVERFINKNKVYAYAG